MNDIPNDRYNVQKMKGDTMIISEKIFMIMREQKMSMRELGRRTGITASTISDWNTKKMNPGADKLLVISKALGVSVEELLEDTDTFQKKTVEEIDVEKMKDEDILAQYHSFTTGQKRHLLEYMKRLGEEYAEEK